MSDVDLVRSIYEAMAARDLERLSRLIHPDIPEVHRWQVRDGQVIAAHFAIDSDAMLRALAGG